MASVHRDIRSVDTAIVYIAAAKDITTILEAVRTVALPCLIVQLLLIVATAISNTDELRPWISTRLVSEIAITDVTLVQCDIGRSKHGTTLTTTVCITLDGRNTIGKRSAIEVADDNMGLTRNIVCGCIADSTRMISHCSCPSATIDITAGAALDVGIGRGNEVGSTKEVIDCSHSTGSIKVFRYFSTEQGNIGGTIDVTTTGKLVVSLTIATAIGIVAHISTLVDDDVGVISLKSWRSFRIFAVVHLCRSCKRILQIGGFIGVIVECSRKS